jgi:penicillin-binding protein 1C
MQVVRLLEPRPRTILSKLLESFRAFQLELHYSKNEILGYYLSLTPYGSNIEGVTAASLLYFGKAPALLSPAEAVTLNNHPQPPLLSPARRRKQKTSH